MEVSKQKANKQKVQVWIWRRKVTGKVEVLVLQTNPLRGGFWQPVTGSVDSGEKVIDAALREAREETGIQFRAEPEDLQYSFTFDTAKGLVEEFCFSLEAAEESPVLLDGREHQAFAWLPTREVEGILKHESNREAFEIWMQFFLRRHRS